MNVVSSVESKQDGDAFVPEHEGSIMSAVIISNQLYLIDWEEDNVDSKLDLSEDEANTIMPYGPFGWYSFTV